MRFSLFHFSADGSKPAPNKYQLVLATAAFADKNNFWAIWTPERHFQDFGGLYPNPSVLSAAIAMLTERIRICAGSVSLPLHNPIRVAEEWAVVDRLSHGRVGISFASGWHPNDFVLSPTNYRDRKDQMFESLQLIRQLWSGESIIAQDGNGVATKVRIFPTPVQSELPTWITTSGSLDTWERAGAIGSGVLAALIGQSINDLEKKIKLYRKSLETHGYSPESGQVTIMLHTYIGSNNDAIRREVREPLRGYIATYINQFKNTNLADGGKSAVDVDANALADFAFERYFKSNALLGTLDKCSKLVAELDNIGVNEIACLVDFGVNEKLIMKSLPYLNDLREQFR